MQGVFSMKKIIILLLSVSVIFNGIVGLTADCAVKVNPELTVKTALVAADSGSLIEENGGYDRVNCGYLAKLMTVLVVADCIKNQQLSLEDTLTASPTVTGTKGAVVWLKSGDKMTVDELLKSVIVGNANDAVTVLAENCAVSVDKFTEEMNRKAFEIGLRNTAFYSPYGYYDEREYSTAADIGKICAELVDYDFVMPYFSIWRDFVKEGVTELVSENTLINTWDPHIGFKACGGENSGYCIAEGGVSEDGTAYIAVVLGAPNNDVSFSTAKTLLKKAFTEYKATVPGFMDELLRPLKIKKR